MNKFKDWLLVRESGFVITPDDDPEQARNNIPSVTVDDGSPVGGDPIFKKKNGCRSRKKSKKK
jgi:hypothetical protein